MAPPKSPIGISLGKGYTVGPKIGEGAQCAVHAVLYKKQPSPYVAKCAPLPPFNNNPKKKGTTIELNANSLNKEATWYRNLRKLQEKSIPRMGMETPAINGVLDYDGYKFLILERMEYDLVEGIPMMISGSDKTIMVGPIAERLLKITEQFHFYKQLVVDVKPENIMFASAPADDDDQVTKKSRKTKASSANMEKLAQRLRFVDLGLIQPFISASTGEHAENVAGADLAGTPLYCSRNVHHGNTVSRRDDVESIGIVSVEVLIRLIAVTQGTPNNYERTRKPSYLPWANGANDAAIGRVKVAMMKDIKSEFYKLMGSMANAKAMHKYFAYTAALEYEDKPDYDMLKELLATLELPKTGMARESMASATSARSNARGATAAAATKSMESAPKKVKYIAYDPVLDSPPVQRRRSLKSDEMSVDSDDDDDESESAKPLSRAAHGAPKAATSSKKQAATSKAAVGSKAKAASGGQKTVGKRTPIAFVPGMDGTKVPRSSKGLDSSSDDNSDYESTARAIKKSRNVKNGDKKLPAKKTPPAEAKKNDSSGDDNDNAVSACAAKTLKTTTNAAASRKVATSNKKIAAKPATAARMSTRLAARAEVGADGVIDMDVDDSDDAQEPRGKPSCRYAMEIDSDDDESLSMDIVNKVKLPAASPLGAKTTMTLKVVDGPHKRENLSIVMSKKHHTVIIGNGSALGKNTKEMVMSLGKEKDLEDVHCKLVFDVTRSGTCRINLVAKADGVTVNKKPAKVGKTITMFAGSSVWIGETSIHVF